MGSLDALVTQWSRLGWLLLLVFTAATLVVAGLRKPCRKAFGAERAFLLWLLPPVAMSASLLPRAAAPAARLPAIMVAITTWPGSASFVMHPGAVNGVGWIAVLWLAGVTAALLLAAGAQWRYHAKLRGAVPVDDIPSRWPVLRSMRPHVGPALVGALRLRIVLPADFDTRYDGAERQLILAHETMHACRHDGLWCLIAQLVTVTFWFHPLVWWALSVFRRDQEMACDAAVLRERRGQRRSYATAMLKAASSSSLPIGCAWSSRHPLTERIAMLKQPQYGRIRHGVGIACMTAAILFGAGCAYATGGAPAASVGAGADRYTLKLVVAINGQPPRLHATACLRPGKSYMLTEGVDRTLPPWHGSFSVASASSGLLEVRAELSGGTLTKPVYPRVRTHPGQTATIMLGDESAGKAGGAMANHTIKIDLTPSVGC